MLIDADGNSIDITVYKLIDEKGTIRQIMPTKCLNFGIFNINNKMINVLKNFLEKKKLRKL